MPQATTIGILVNPGFSSADAQQRAVEEAGCALNLRVPVLRPGNDGQIAEAFETMVQQHAGALAVGAHPSPTCAALCS